MSAVVLFGCPSDKPAFDENDRLIQKLKAEQNKPLVRPPPPPQTDLDKLAQAATAPQAPQKHAVPTEVQTVGDFDITLASLETMTTVGTEKVALSTDESFVRLKFDLTPKKAASLRLKEWVLRKGAVTYPIAVDAQKVAQGTPLVAELQAKTTQTIVTYFELPLSSVGPGLELLLAPDQVVRVQ